MIVTTKKNIFDLTRKNLKNNMDCTDRSVYNPGNIFHNKENSDEYLVSSYQEMIYEKSHYPIKLLKNLIKSMIFEEIYAKLKLFNKTRIKRIQIKIIVQVRSIKIHLNMLKTKPYINVKIHRRMQICKKKIIIND